jgi:hypothetical protein
MIDTKVFCRPLINDIKEGSEERNRATQWPNVDSRWCMRHMGANFHS